MLPGLGIIILALWFANRHVHENLLGEEGLVQTDYWASPQSFCRGLTDVEPWNLRF